METQLAKIVADSMPDAVACRVLEMEGERFTMGEFIKVNLVDAEQQITLADALNIIALSVGQSSAISSGGGWTHVKRII